MVAAMLLTAMVLAGCSDHEPSGKGQAPARSAASSPGTPASTPSSNGPGIPDDFSLAQGLVTDRETTVSRARRGVRGVDLSLRCWDRTWPGAAVNRLVVQQVGPELSVTRELAIYPDAATAAAVGKQVRLKAERCHRLPGTSEQAAMVVTPLGDGDTEATHVVASFAETMAGGQPGGAVFVFTQVGRAVLAVEDGGEWTRASAVSGARHLQRTDRDLVAQLCLFRDAGC
jgi:hypothetical protein